MSKSKSFHQFKISHLPNNFLLFPYLNFVNDFGGEVWASFFLFYLYIYIYIFIVFTTTITTSIIIIIIKYNCEIWLCLYVVVIFEGSPLAQLVFSFFFILPVLPLSLVLSFTNITLLNYYYYSDKNSVIEKNKSETVVLVASIIDDRSQLSAF